MLASGIGQVAFPIAGIGQVAFLESGIGHRASGGLKQARLRNRAAT